MLGAKSVLVVRWLLGSVAGETRASWIWSYSTYICGYCEAGPEKPPGDLGNAAPTSGDSDRRETFQSNHFVGGRTDHLRVIATSLRSVEQTWEDTGAHSNFLLPDDSTHMTQSARVFGYAGRVSPSTEVWRYLEGTGANATQRVGPRASLPELRPILSFLL